MQHDLLATHRWKESTLTQGSLEDVPRSMSSVRTQRVVIVTGIVVGFYYMKSNEMYSIEVPHSGVNFSQQQDGAEVGEASLQLTLVFRGGKYGH